MKLLKYLQFYCSSSKELLWPSIQAHHSLLSLSNIFSEGHFLSARVTKFGAHTQFFSFWAPNHHVCFSGAAHVQQHPLPQAQPVWLGSRGPGLSILALRKAWYSALLLPGQALFLPGYRIESGQHSYSAPSACILEGNTTLCFSFSKNWGRQPHSQKRM